MGHKLITYSHILLLCIFSILLCTAPSFSQSDANSLRLSEFVPNPSGELETEWVELVNNSLDAINLRLYQIGDELGLRNISDTDLFLFPNEYIILAQDVGQFVQFYPFINGAVLRPVGWQVLNNSGGETVRLADSVGEIIDSFYYESGFSDNRSWERFIDPNGVSYWGGSFAISGSTPGAINAYFYPRTASIDLVVSPDPFSPQLDSYTTITYDPPESDRFDLAIYDISGRKIKDFFESSASIPGEVRWDGRDDSGQILPLGIYIIHARTDNTEVKKTVVIAR